MDLKKSLIILIGISLLFSCGKEASEIIKDNLVIKNVKIIPMTEEVVLKNQSVYIVDGKIEAIGKFQDLDLPEDITVVNGRGKYLLPGFSDMHVHTHYPKDFDLFLINGVTTIRNMWGSPVHLKFKKLIECKSILGPALYTTGPLINVFQNKGSQNNDSQAYWPEAFNLNQSKNVEPAIKQMKADGYDFLKVYNKLRLDVYNEIIRVAGELDIPVVGHVPYDVGLERALQAGQQSIEHFMGYSSIGKSDVIQSEVDLTLKSGVWNCPTLVVIRNMSLLDELKIENPPEIKYVPMEQREYWASSQKFLLGFESAKKLLFELYKAGANIVSGTDAGVAYTIVGFSLHDEFELMNEAGLTPYEVLLTTTVNPAKMLGIEDSAGTIEIGKNADFVLLDKNPLKKISNTRTIAGVMVKGTWIPIGKLELMLDEIEKKYK